MATESITKEQWKGVVTLTGVAEKEGDQYVSYCRELGTSSCGDTAEEALENLGDAIEVHINALVETGEFLRVFRERNIRIDIPSSFNEDVEVSIRVQPKKIFTAYQRPVPVPV
ncbi:MAG: type II toxin-antitoxin system HicB family antitoxin [Chloroflexi bacterium]|nr:type II toxin-antitoxin system HicB family antitoxin [Chloroflexota bacterium]